MLKTLPDLRGFARFLTRDATAADDLVQDTVVRALASQSQFETGTTLKAWLFTIQRNAFYEQRRRSSREQEVMQDFELDMPVSSEAPSMQSARDAVTDLGEILWKLPDLLREAIILVGAQELSYEDAACICNVPPGTMKARVSRARSQLAALTETENLSEIHI
ncbi:DNA-directed RNA polymerase sigma-E/Sigma-24/FecI [Gluconobacter thailandicus F149-1 = NBRC 100600]|uniref:RNA polymerase sigma-E factor (Sigma-24) protein 1 n=1 Tax=Gluconobacter thailandicus NBRC 3257 TaxID=1381097 RepID=A0ABQ0J0M3_GLUTH|nr:sigma-70 family RNA polymerase sigma factor [Gluconobacter thailandicus]AFW02116.1 putative RNA polymerase sigma-E factor (sigma-24) protein 1 [Gluconobacter oxydans H24]ANQ42330.1 RNA polymerase subunit sigma-24 [Gluconobacter oxydans]KXV54874.1 RNA polymerase subunit sigma-24 [Gluconobacter thailandicus]GAC86810.1 RNA polymerase sigma-E factor (sigma-24) protein 1 [Gluconobacter thailandicus NBRC 3255]GAD27997.1 RNA polymerase sigma-E factor (sigma-24) protein 1 [Gluconobacter thailandicu